MEHQMKQHMNQNEGVKEEWTRNFTFNPVTGTQHFTNRSFNFLKDISTEQANVTNAYAAKLMYTTELNTLLQVLNKLYFINKTLGNVYWLFGYTKMVNHKPAHNRKQNSHHFTLQKCKVELRS